MRGLGKVLPGGAEVTTEGGGHIFVGALTSEPFSTVLSHPGMQRKGSWMAGLGFGWSGTVEGKRKTGVEGIGERMGLLLDHESKVDRK